MLSRNLGEAYKKGLHFMSNLYERIHSLCDERGINITQMCKESGASRGSLTDLKSGRKQDLSLKTLTKIADYFGVSVDFLTREENAPTENGGRAVSDEEIMFALFGGKGNITMEMYEEVKEFARFVQQREEAKNKK